MFAPHCPACRRQVLLGTGRIVHFAWNGDGAHVVVLRCFCGELVDSDQQPVDQHLAPIRTPVEVW